MQREFIPFFLVKATWNYDHIHYGVIAVVSTLAGVQWFSQDWFTGVCRTGNITAVHTNFRIDGACQPGQKTLLPSYHYWKHIGFRTLFSELAKHRDIGIQVFQGIKENYSHFLCGAALNKHLAKLLNDKILSPAPLKCSGASPCQQVIRPIFTRCLPIK